MSYPRQKPKHQIEWTTDEMKLVFKLLKEFTVDEVVKKTGINRDRIIHKAQLQGWPIRNK